MKAQQLMGVGLPSDAGRRTFSSDVLKIEICGPKQQHLSVVDVPGIFRRITEGVTTQRDKALVREMMITYMKNPRAVILGGYIRPSFALDDLPEAIVEAVHEIRLFKICNSELQDYRNEGWTC